MRIWDVDPGYLSRQRLLGEHRELHGMASIIAHNKKGYSRHPETLRWHCYGWALNQRHKQLACEMQLRGYQHHSPVRLRKNNGQWPQQFIDLPEAQFALLSEKYGAGESGRIPLPKNCQTLWRQHKYSLLARNPRRYKEIGCEVAADRIAFPDLAVEMVDWLRVRPQPGGIRNALQHMWGYLSEGAGDRQAVVQGSLPVLLHRVQKATLEHGQPYLLQSTALAELGVWL